MTSKAWYAVYTRPRAEKKVSARLSGLGIRTYCPLQRVQRQWHDRMKVVEEPVFRSYVFVCADDSERTQVLEEGNVVNFVRHCGRPATIREEEIQAIERFLDTYEGVTFQVATVVENDRVRVEAGAFTDCTGVVVKKVKNKAFIRIEFFNAYLIAEVADSKYVKVA